MAAPPDSMVCVLLGVPGAERAPPAACSTARAGVTGKPTVTALRRGSAAPPPGEGSCLPRLSCGRPEACRREAAAAAEAMLLTPACRRAGSPRALPAEACRPALGACSATAAIPAAPPPPRAPLWRGGRACW